MADDLNAHNLSINDLLILIENTYHCQHNIDTPGIFILYFNNPSYETIFRLKFHIN